MSNYIVFQKPSTPIIDRFKALLKDRDDEMMLVLAKDEAPPLNTNEIVCLYDLVLSELTFNSKPIINELTTIAGEQWGEQAEAVAGTICARIIEAPVEQKLPSLYLLDSIVKNIGREYATYFSACLPKVFCEAYRQVHPNLHPPMRHLFGTWSTVFPYSILRKIEAQLQFPPSVNRRSSGASESPGPTHGIHVNPKYLEARHQFEHSTANSNSQHAREPSSSLKMHGKPASGYDEYDSGNAEDTSSLVASQRLSSTACAGRTSFALGAKKLPSSSVTETARSSSPFGTGHLRSLSPKLDEFPTDDSPIRVVERVSPSHAVFEYGLGRVMGKEEAIDCHRVQWSDGVELQKPRVFVDAYGTDQGKRSMDNKPLKVQNVDVNGIDSKVDVRTWQNTEEEEFDWEEMSPTLADRGLSTDLFPLSTTPHANFRTRPGFEAQRAAPLETDISRGNWSSQAQPTMVNGSSISLEDEAPSIRSGPGLINTMNGFRNEVTQFPVSRFPQETWNFPWNSQRSSQQQFNAKGSGRNFPMPFAAMPLPVELKPPLTGGSPDADAQLCGSSTAALGMSSSLDSLNPEVLSAAAPASTGTWAPLNVNKSVPLTLQPTHPPQKHISSRFDSMGSSSAGIDQSLNKFNTIEGKAPHKLPQFLHQRYGPYGLISLNQQSQAQPQLQMAQEVQQNLVPPVPTPSYSFVPPPNFGYIPQGHGASIRTILSNTIMGTQSSMPILSIRNTSLHLPGGALQPLPPGPLPASSQMIAVSQNPGPITPNPPAGGALQGLIGSLVAQGLISLAKPVPMQDSVGLEFDPDLHKVRHESAITALYSDLPRQCTTCGLRFEGQEEHSSHMDWHVTKNRVSKNHKQKPSRKWFVSVTMWLSGAEALGNDTVPRFLPTENVVEKKDEEDMAVPADEDQTVCALCGEPFDDFYSDVTEEWMYKEAVYMNAPTGSTAGMDRSQLGPIVHAKCRPESSAVSPEDFGKTERGYTEEEGSQRKRMRS